MHSAKAEPLEIVLVGDPRLEQVAARVERVDDDLRVAASRMHATLDAFRERTGYGRGLAAPQVGVMHRVVVMNLVNAPPAGIGAGPFTLVNPEMIWQSGEWFEVWDDCLSVPDILVRVRRRTSVTVRFRDLDGREQTWERLAPDIAELVQHEIDHLDGVLMTERAYGPDAIRPIAEREKLVGNSRRAARIAQ